jgi:hypothetical protein
MADAQSEADVIRKLGKLLEQAGKESGSTLTTGACVYNAGGKTYCAVLTKSQCDVFSGSIWTANGKCP